jgi:hypothetical protein
MDDAQNYDSYIPITRPTVWPDTSGTGTYSITGMLTRSVFEAVYPGRRIADLEGRNRGPVWRNTLEFAWKQDGWERQAEENSEICLRKTGLRVEILNPGPPEY